MVEPNPQVYFDISIDGAAPFRLEFELYKRDVPLTAENFRALCTGEKSTATEKLHFKDSIFHRIIPGFMAQGGDFTRHNGTGGKSIYGEKFRDENFKYKHTEGGLLSMANAGPHTNGSQFFITFVATPWLDGKHVIFGKVIKGLEYLKTLEARGSDSGKPKGTIKIVNCGQL
eukprot:TRINITY_DN2415_c0_g1_i1.p1 TRINITY_DN2415_c0_g1~~TRINITY_DN2415_c0_g1_i1.p1  ORF type:complete len:172 (-),score=57.51 TRINITY_DN2415_c0_g1_i1:165-680(-)